MRPPGKRGVQLGLGLGGSEGPEGHEGDGDPGWGEGWVVEALRLLADGTSGWEAGARTPWCLSFSKGRPGWFWEAPFPLGGVGRKAPRPR